MSSGATAPTTSNTAALANGKPAATIAAKTNGNAYPSNHDKAEVAAAAAAASQESSSIATASAGGVAGGSGLGSCLAELKKTVPDFPGLGDKAGALLVSECSQ